MLIAEKKRTIVEVYDYTDEDGTLVHQAVRYEPKGFGQRRPDGNGGYHYNLQDTRRVLYRLSEVVRASKILILEGEKDVETAYSMGLPDDWAATCNPMGAEKWKDEYSECLNSKQVVIIPDNDEPGERHLTKVQKSLQGIATSVSVCRLPKGKDLSEWAALQNPEHLQSLFHKLLIPQDRPEEIPSPDTTRNVEEEVQRLASLPSLEYGLQRAIFSKKWQIPLEWVDKAVKDAKPKTDSRQHLQGEEITFPDITPSEHQVDGATLLDFLLKFLQRYLVLPPGGAVTAVLWVIFTFARDLFGINPRLVASSPEKRCGKTTFLEVLFFLVFRPLLSSNVTPAALFRTIQRHYPTLLIDEIDSFQDAHEELRGLINSGHTRRLAQVIRVVGDDHEPRTFSTWCTMVLALIGRLPDTIEDRSLNIRMQRKKPNERVERFPRAGAQLKPIHEEAELWQRQCLRWVEDNREALVNAQPKPIPKLSDRANDNWFPLLAIAEVIGAPWPEKAREAALVISGHELEDNTIGIQLLTDIQGIFASVGVTRLASKDLCEELERLEERPWSTWSKGKPLSPNKLAKELGKFGISSRTIRVERQTPKGYLKEDFSEAWERYCSLGAKSPDSKGNTATILVNKGENNDLPNATEDSCCGTENSTLTNTDAPCGVVALPEVDSESEGGLIEETSQFQEVEDTEYAERMD